VFRVSGVHPPTPDSAEQVALPHHPEHLLVMHLQSLPFQLLSNPPVAIAGILKTHGFNLTSQIRLVLRLYLALALEPVIEAAPCKLHHLTLPLDSNTETSPCPDDLPFL